MPGDYTKLRFKPENNASSILQQQGRVMLDQDWNEFVQLVDRRWRSETIDIIGTGVVPILQTPDAFEILVTAGPPSDLTIGVGRIYVDGIQAENHGLAPDAFDPVLAETPGCQPVPFELQPYFPAGLGSLLPACFTLPSDGNPFLVYLDVWERETNYLEFPDLVDQAVGVDTTTRIQTVWQVKVLSDIGASTCTTPDNQVPEWLAATARSAGLLSSYATGVPQSTDPCTIPPDGGYRGTDNLTYRVEIHTPGAPGVAQFKYSRNNASFASQVTNVDSSGKVLTVVLTKRDSVLRFNPNCWVEVTDDSHEFAGLAGEMHQVTHVDDVLLQITLDSALTTPFDLTDLQARHTRVILWDQQTSTSLIAVPATGATAPTQPTAWATTLGATTLDGTVTWQIVQVGAVQPWKAGTPYYPGNVVSDGTNWQQATNAGISGTPTAPTWGTTLGALTTDGGTSPLIWKLVSLGAASGWAASGTVALGTLVKDSNGNWQQAVALGVALENGIQVGFGIDPAAPSGAFQIGDYWTFAARVVDASVETLAGAPPRGIHHHYCRLAVINSMTSTPTDCRQFWPPAMGDDCVCCTVSVGDGVLSFAPFTDIQLAIDSLDGEGGVVCLGRGVFTVTKTINLKGNNLTIKGTGWATSVVFAPEGDGSSVLFQAEECQHVTLESMFMLGVAADALVEFRESSYCTVRDCGLVNIPVTSSGPLSSWVPSRFGNGWAISLQGRCVDITVERNAIIASEGIVGLEDGVLEVIRVLSNTIRCAQISVDFNLASVSQCEIRGNLMNGLATERVTQLVGFWGNGITVSTISPLQTEAVDIFVNSSNSFTAQNYGVALDSADALEMTDNLIVALVGVQASTLFASDISDNEICAVIGGVTNCGLAVTIADNLVVGWYCGWAFTGLILKAACTGNTWLGLSGVVSSAEAVVFGGLATLFPNVGLVITAPAQALLPVPILLDFKVTDSLFLSLFYAVYADPFTLVSDVVVINGNTIFVCEVGGIYWNAPGILSANEATLVPHQFRNNVLIAIQGIGILVAAPQASIGGNTIECKDLALWLQCVDAVVSENTILGGTTSDSTNGMITLDSSSSFTANPSYRLFANTLYSSPGYAILVDADLALLELKDNLLQGVGLTAVFVGAGLTVDVVKIVGNDITQYAADGIVIPELTTDGEIGGNRLVASTPTSANGLALNINWDNYFMLATANLRIHDNRIDSIVPTANITLGGYPYMGTSIQAAANALQFTGNQCQQQLQPNGYTYYQTYAVAFLCGQAVVANANTVLSTGWPPQEPWLGNSSLWASLVVGAPSPGSSGTTMTAIVTSNIINNGSTNLGYYGPTYLVNANNVTLP